MAEIRIKAKAEDAEMKAAKMKAQLESQGKKVVVKMVRK